MTKDLLIGIIFLSTAATAVCVGETTPSSSLTSKWDRAAAEQTLMVADQLWRTNSAALALASYESLLENLPEECEPFRSLVIMRLAQAAWVDGKTNQCREALRSLAALDYVPEHHARAASELLATIATGTNPATQRTPIPPLPVVATSLCVSADGPFHTLSDAVVQARQIRKRGEGGCIEIVLAPGIYTQRETVVLGQGDSGLIIRSLNRKQPATLTGGIRLDRWEKVKDAEALAQLPESVRDRVLVCDLGAHGITNMGELVFGGVASRRKPEGTSRFAAFPIPELFHRGLPQIMARWPNETLIKMPVTAPPLEPDPRYARWARERDLWLFGYWQWDWADAYEKVERIEASGRIVLAEPTNGYGHDLSMGCALNALCELDVPGEWHLDTSKNRIHFLPPDDFDPAACVVSYFGTVIAATECADLQVRDLCISDLRGDGMTFADCPRLLLAGVAIQHCSGSGIRLHGGPGPLIHSCTIDSMGRGGIDVQAGDWARLIPGHAIIENCRISALSRIDHTYTPGLLLQGMDIKVRHTSFINIPSSAIRVETCDALIELNYFHNCVYESGDQGAIDVWANPLYRGNVIRWNDFDRIINTSGASFGAAAIRLDDFISGFMISENIFRGGSPVGFGSVQFNMGTDSYVDGNVIINWARAFSGRSLGGDSWKERLNQHDNARRVLAETDWQSEAWRAKYPMVRDLLRGDDNHNYLADNLRLGSGALGDVERAVTFANVEGEPSFTAERIDAVKPLLVPWHAIPVDLIGPYDMGSGGKRQP